MTDDITRRREHRLADHDLADANRARGLPADTGVAITDVDCTPRPRRGESQVAFDARIAGYMREAGLVQREVDQRNRNTALRLVDDGGRIWRNLADVPDHRGITAYFTQCACGWCGLRVADPEVARREYDAHACAAANIGNDAVSRAQAHAGKATMPPKRKASVLQPAAIAPEAPAEAQVKRAEPADDFEQRAALLELK